jgi:hypothetical protein
MKTGEFFKLVVVIVVTIVVTTTMVWLLSLTASPSGNPLLVNKDNPGHLRKAKQSFPSSR